MASTAIRLGSMLLVLGIFLVLMPGKAHAFGAGNIPSIAQVEGHNWRHGDIEDILKTVAFLHGKKWTTMMVKRVYFGNWLRDYSQAVDVGSLKGVNAATIRILVWVLSFMSFGYATEEFEVTEERLGVYRPEEHIDNPLGYADGADARTYDARLRGPVDPKELEIDMSTGMKNYIKNESGGWATSAGYLRYSLGRSIHFGRVYTNGSGGSSGRDSDLCEALRCLGQSLHCMEDYSAHSNYCELALRELGYNQVFPHCGVNAEINLRGKRVYPIATGTFGAVDFLHSVLGEATDHFTQSEVDEVDVALKNAQGASGGGGGGTRGIFGPSSSGAGDFISLVSDLPGIGGGFAAEARDLKAASEAQERANEGVRERGTNVNIVPGMSENFDPVRTAKQIYPILEFRDKIVKAINNMIAKVPGLEKLLDHISETLTAFVLGLLAPFVRPIIEQVSKQLKNGSSGVISASANSQLEPWKDPNCTNPTHSMLSKDHFTNVLNSCAGRVAATVLQYVVPRVLYAWERPGVPVDEVVNDVLRAFHHPAIRDESVQIQREMFDTVRQWTNEYPRRNELNFLLSSESVRNGKNHIIRNDQRSSGGHSHGSGLGGWANTMSDLGHGKVAGSLWNQVRTRDMDAMGGGDGSAQNHYLSSSPAPGHAGERPPPSPAFGYNQHQGQLHSQSHHQSSAPTGGAADMYMNPNAQPHHHQQQPPQGYGGGYGGPPPQQGGYGQYPPQGQYGGYGQGPPPPGYWGQGPPPPGGGYGGGYGGPPPGQYPPYGQPPWGGYPQY